ncbi:hypothetical protein FHX49_002235 [Microbacterium endophyticum]|uniref:Uncharacterized protein n=1 Tax=Microbacterium endophyticum TaxID=1526412 RepID=A0A7W4V4F3_9MICO|nr:hypothetical protein [Microbacterium endophyticum]MBB2976656.1 hypothetical protein [Microbacterium endophyticum]NIK37715.1 hypothetical protein [Microbacterium endophyticum]
MTTPEPQPSADNASDSPLLRVAIWVAIGALIAAALVCVVWVLVGESNGLVGRAFLTIVLLTGFAGIAILEVHLAERRPLWFSLLSMGSWILALLIGAFLTWMPESSYFFGSSSLRVFSFFLIVLILQLALLHIRLYSRAYQRYRMTFTTVISYITMGLVAVLAVLLVLPLMLSEWVDFHSLYWRIVVAVAILGAVGTALVPLVNVLFAPKKPKHPAAPFGGASPSWTHAAAQATQHAAPTQSWPTYVDGFTPLPVMVDGTPDWNAYYTGYPSPGAIDPRVETWVPPKDDAPATGAAPESRAGYEGFPPPPPLPPRD